VLHQWVSDGQGLLGGEVRFDLDEEEARMVAKKCVAVDDGAGKIAGSSPVLHEVELGDLEEGGIGADGVRPVQKVGVVDAGRVLLPEPGIGATSIPASRSDAL